MEYQKNIKRKGLIYLIISIVFAIIGFIVNYQNRIAVSSENKYENFQSDFLKREQMLNELFAKLILRPVKNSVDLVNFCHEHKVNKDDFVFFVYRDSLLAAWSSNEIDPSRRWKCKFPEVMQMDNKWVYVKQAVIADACYVACLMIDNIDNEDENSAIINDHYLHNVFRESSKKNKQPTNYTIYNKTRKAVFTIFYPPVLKKNNTAVFCEIILWLIAFTAFSFAFICFVLQLKFFQRRSNLLFLILSVLLFIAARFVFGSINASSDLFSPIYYSSHFASLGSLFANTYLILLASVFFMQFINMKRLTDKSKKTKIGISSVFVLLVLLYHLLAYKVILGITTDSVVVLRPEMIYQYDLFSIIAVSSIVFILWSAFIVTYTILNETFLLLKNKKVFMLILLAGSTIGTLCFSIFYILNNVLSVYILYLLFILLITVISVYILYKKKLHNLLFHCIIYLILSIITLFTANQTVDEREKKYKESMAEMILSNEDPFVLYSLHEMGEEMEKDTNLPTMFLNIPFVVNDIRSYIVSKYLKKYAEDYRICIDVGFETFSDEDHKAPHKHTHNGIVSDTIDKVSFRRIGFGRSEYRICIAIPLTNDQTGRINIVFRMYIASEQQFELEKILQKEMSNYSYAGYENNILKMNADDGAIHYLYNLSDYHLDTLYSGMDFVTDNITHTVFVHEGTVVLISSAKRIVWDKISFVIILFLLQLIFSLLPMLLSTVFHSTRSLWKQGFQDSIQFFVIILITLTVTITAFSFSRFVKITKTHDMISLHAQISQRINKIINTTVSRMDATNLSDEMTDRINEELLHFYELDFIDLNLYNQHGEKLESYGKGIYMSTYLNPLAYKALSLNKTETFIVKENHNRETYRSFYQTILNKQGEIIGYSNLISYTNKERELFDYRHTQFLTKFMTICIIIVLFIVGVSILFIRHITRPLAKVTERLSNIKLGGELKEITWNKDDELGQLVKTYNMLINRLQTSAELLEKSSQEVAWKDMSRQIAHEIKNPLTPIRLTTQQMLRELDKNDRIDKQKLERYFDMIIQQTDMLTEIASSFASFANVNQQGGSPENLIPIIQNTISSYSENQHVEFFLHNRTHQEEVISFVNKSQISRVFNNLIKNAIQAKKQD
ncbi:MAG: HAMP domain-containing protein, partial [Bacteroidales bacterium]|nr:HAMP domain-containing protein [Bacteroidales bacterium]